MSRRTLYVVLGVVVLLWASRFVVDPRPPSGPTDPAQPKAEGDAWFEAADFSRAARSYRLAFALEDPRDPKRQSHRRFLAFQVARSLARYVSVPPATAGRADLERAQDGATRWLDETLALDPGEGWAHYERAILLDRCPEPLRKPEVARGAYEAFVAWVDDADAKRANKPAADEPVVTAARKRLAELGS